MASPQDLPRDPRVADLAACAREIVHVLASLAAASDSGAAVKDAVTRLANRLSDQHRALVEEGVPLHEFFPTASVPDEEGTVRALATDPRLVQDLVRALPRLAVAAPADAAAVPASTLDTWRQGVREARAQDAGATLATLTLPGRTVSVVTASAKRHPEQKVLDLLAADHHAELLGASMLTLISTGPMCAACCVSLLRLLAAFPRLRATVGGLVGPVAGETVRPTADADDEPPAGTDAIEPAVDPDALRVAIERLGSLRNVDAAQHDQPEAPPPVPEPELSAAYVIHPDELRATLDRLRPRQDADDAAMIRPAPATALSFLDESDDVIDGDNDEDLDDVIDLDDNDDDDPFGEPLAGLLRDQDHDVQAAESEQGTPADLDDDIDDDLDLDLTDDDPDLDDLDVQEFEVEKLDLEGPVSAPPDPAPAVAPEPAPTEQSPDVPAAATVDLPERNIALLVRSLHEVVRFLPAFTAVDDHNQAEESNIELQHLAARVAERYDVLDASTVSLAQLPDSEFDRLAAVYELDLAGTQDDGAMADAEAAWESSLTRQVLRDTRLSVGARTEGTVTVLTGRTLMEAIKRLRVAAPIDPQVGPDPAVAREWQRIVTEAGEGQAALATLTLPSGENLTIMTTSGKGLVEAFVAGSAVARKGRLPRYLSHPPASPGGDEGPARHLDAEKQLLDYLGTNHHADLDQSSPTVTVVCTEPTCPSCCFVALQFLADFPSVSGLTVRLAAAGRLPARGLRRLLPGNR